MDSFIDIEIKKMILNDAEEIQKLENTIFSHPWSRKSLEKTLLSEQNLCMIVRDKETKAAVGYCIFTTSFEVADLCRIAVSQEFRRKHIAEKIIKISIEELKKRNVSRILLEVRKNNISAISLYEKYGFKQIGIRKEYYSEPVEDGLVYELYIPAITTIH